MTTVLETIDGGARYLAKRGIEDARRNMQMLVAHQLGWARMELYLRFDDPVPEEHLAGLREMLKKRGEGVPLQHLLGTVWFHGREFKTDARALIPRPETEELAEIFLALDLPSDARVLDVGSGSGVLGLTLAGERPGWAVTLVDLSSDALALSRENMELLGIPNAGMLESDLFAACSGRRYHGIAANLPYVPESDRESLSREVRHDPELALFGGGADGLDVIRRFVSAAPDFLEPGSWLAMEIGWDQGEAVAELLAENGFRDVEVRTDMSGIARFPLARWG